MKVAVCFDLIYHISPQTKRNWNFIYRDRDISEDKIEVKKETTVGWIVF
jgi:hypothetical protein